jgi:adenylate cyclase, class 2
METVEVEARFRLECGLAVSSQLCAQGVTLSAPMRQDDQAYAPVGWEYGDDRIDVSFARLRTEDDRHLFTVKRPISDVRTCVEHECHVSDREAMHGAILLMGYRPTVRIVKTRRTALLDDRIAICLDDVEGVGMFIELEALASESDDHDSLRAELEAIVSRLGIAAEQCADTYDALVYTAAEAA